MKKLLFACVLLILSACASAPVLTPRQQVENCVDALLTAYQNKNLQAFMAQTAASRSDKKALETRLLNVFFARSQIHISDVSVQTVFLNEKWRAHIGLDISFLRRIDDRQDAQAVQKRVFVTAWFVKIDGKMKLAVLENSDLL